MWGKCGENPENKNRLIRMYQQIKRFSWYPEPDSPIYYDRSGMVTNFNVSAIYLSWLVTKSMPYS